MTLPRRSAQPSPTETPAGEAADAPADAAPRRLAKPRAAAAPKTAAARLAAAAAPADATTAPRPPRTPPRGRATLTPLPAAEPRAEPMGEAAAPTARPRAAPRARKTAHLAPAGALPPAQIPPEALRAPRQDRLLVGALVASLVLHAVALAIHFSPLDLRSLADKGPPLEVALVNARSPNKPTKADILAQANLDGGGNTDQDRRAKTPLPVLPRESAQNDVSIASQKVQALEQQTRELLTQLRAQPVAAAQQKPVEATEATDSPTANDLMQRTIEALRLEAQIAKDMDAYQKRPKRRFVGARAEEYRFARYVEDWRSKVERVGNMNYPEAARVNRLYGSLVLTVSIRSDGTIENVEVNKPSGKRILDAAAVKIVQMSGPYAPFPADIRRDTDILHITRTWTFAKGDELHSD